MSISVFYHVFDVEERGQEEDNFFRQVVEGFPDCRNLVAAEKTRTWKRDRKSGSSSASASGVRIFVHLFRKRRSKFGEKVGPNFFRNKTKTKRKKIGLTSLPSFCRRRRRRRRRRWRRRRFSTSRAFYLCINCDSSRRRHPTF